MQDVLSSIMIGIIQFGTPIVLSLVTIKLILGKFRKNLSLGVRSTSATLIPIVAFSWLYSQELPYSIGENADSLVAGVVSFIVSLLVLGVIEGLQSVGKDNFPFAEFTFCSITMFFVFVISDRDYTTPSPVYLGFALGSLLYISLRSNILGETFS